VSIKVETVKGTDEQIQHLSRNIRNSDKRLINLWGYADVSKFIKEAFTASTQCLIGLVDGEPAVAVCILPIGQSFISDKAYIWLVATDKIRSAPFGVLQKSLYHIRKIMNSHRTLVAYIDESDTKAQKYAYFLGFKPGEGRVTEKELTLREYIKS